MADFMDEHPEDEEILGPGGKPPFGPSIWFPPSLLREYESARRINWQSVNVDAIGGWYRTAGVLFGIIFRVNGLTSLRWGITKIDSLRGPEWIHCRGAPDIVDKSFFVVMSLVAQRVRSNMQYVCPGMWRFLS